MYPQPRTIAWGQRFEQVYDVIDIYQETARTDPEETLTTPLLPPTPT